MIDIVITGSSGFIGSALLTKLQSKNYNVFGLTKSFGNIEELSTWKKLPKSKFLFHLAGKTFVPVSWEKPKEFFLTNVLGTQNAIDWCIKNNTKLIFSSTYIYGKPKKLPVSETHSVQPNNPYALSKHLAEQLCQFANKYQNLNVTILRLFNVYGINQSQQFLLPKLINQISKKI